MNSFLPKTFFKFLFIAVLFIGQYSHGQLASWSLTADGNASGVDANATATAFVQGAGVSAITFGTTGAFSTGWSTGAIDLTDYFEVTIAPNASYSMNVTQFNFSERRSGTGIRNYQVRWSVDDFSTSTTIATVSVPDDTSERDGSITGLNIDVADGETLKFRIYGYTSEAGGGTWRINDGTLNIVGTVVSAGPTAPTVLTTAASSITTTSADSGGDVTADGGAAVTVRGVAFSTAVNPTTGTSDGTGTGMFTSSLTGLSLNTEYFYRAFATNSVGTAYGSELSFFTLAATPGILSVSNPQFTTLDVTIDATTENGNPAATEYAIQETGGQYVQTDGSLGATVVWQTATTWATTTVTGLSASTTYTFQTKARNGDAVETVFGATNSGTTLSPPTADYNVVQFPNTTQTITEGTSFTVYIRAYEDGITNLAGESTRLKGWVGYSQTDGNPANVGWTWTPATFNVQVGNDDEYQADIPSSLAAGTYYYAARFEIDDSMVYTYGGSGGNWNNDSVTLIVNADVVDFANVQSPALATITEGETVTIFAQVFEPGITPSVGQGTGITAEVGYSSTDTTPDGTWTWLPATYNVDFFNNDEYQADLGAGLTPGTYYYASRFIKDGRTQYVYGGTGGVWNNDNGVLTVEALGVPVATAGTALGQTQFTANWDAVAGATSYRLDVSTSPTFTAGVSSGDVPWINEFHYDNAGADVGEFVEIVVPNTYSGTNLTVSLYNGGNGQVYDSALLSSMTTGSTTANQTIYYYNFTGSIQNGAPDGFSLSDDTGLIQFLSYEGTFTGTDGPANGIESTDIGQTEGGSTPIGFSLQLSGTGNTYSDFAWQSEASETKGSLNNGQTLTAPTTGSSAFVAGYEDLNVGNVLSYQVTGLDPETTYYYRVRAVLGAVTSGNSNVIDVKTKPTTVTWDGTAWSNIDGPDETINAIIEGAYVTGTDGEFSANNLTLTSGSFTVSSGTSITVTDVLENELTATDFLVENNANLIQANDVNNIGSITVQRNSAEIMRLDYTLWSSPVVGQNLLDFSPETVVNRFYVYNPSNNQYATITPSTNSFAEGTGYLIRAADNHPTTPTVWSGSFMGEPHNGDVTISVANSTYNAVGNPYPSTISADDFITENSLSEALYFWRKINGAAGSAYATYTLAGGAGTGSSNSNAEVPNGTIQVGQGFIALATSTSLVFTNEMRTANQANQFFRNTNTEKNRIWLNISNTQNVVGQTMIAYMENSSLEFDAMYDGKYINDSQTAFTSLLNNEEYAVQARGSFSATDVVPMNFKTETTGTYSIALANADGLFETEEDIFVKDNETGIEHNLRNAAYEFTTEAGVFANRFEIVYQSTLGVTIPDFANQTIVFAKDNFLNVQSSSDTITAIQVFDVQGRLVLEVKDINASTYTTSLNQISNGVLVVKVIAENGSTTTKKVIK